MAPTAAFRAHKLRMMEKTHGELQSAISRIVNGRPRRVPKGSKLTVNNVAKEAGVDRSTIYKFHSAILSDIQSRNSTTPKAVLKEKRSELAQATERVKGYRQMTQEAQADKEKLLQVNYRLNQRTKDLEKLLEQRDKVIKELQKKLNARDSGKVASLERSAARKLPVHR
jgi:predicted transcriptional regulator